jgi:hypothetical protein
MGRDNQASSTLEYGAFEEQPGGAAQDIRPVKQDNLFGR